MFNYNALLRQFDREMMHIFCIKKLPFLFISLFCVLGLSSCCSDPLNGSKIFAETENNGQKVAFDESQMSVFEQPSRFAAKSQDHKILAQAENKNSKVVLASTQVSTVTTSSDTLATLKATNKPAKPYARSYVIKGHRYYVLSNAKDYSKTGVASWYGHRFHGRRTSSRERFNLHGMTAASPNLPLLTYVRVTNLENGKQVVVKINDRGPFVGDRIIDLSYAAAKRLGFAYKGLANVKVENLSSADIDNDQPAARVT
jgi:rare lipoprotein A (peptidoglycan hydrolase)